MPMVCPKFDQKGCIEKALTLHNRKSFTRMGLGKMFTIYGNVVDLDFADDVALLADTWMVLVGMVMRMELVTQRFGINISAKKSEVMYVGRGSGDLSHRPNQPRIAFEMKSGDTWSSLPEISVLY